VADRVLILKKDRIAYVIDRLCAVMGIDKANIYDLSPPYDKTLYNARALAIKILRDIADCTVKDIQYEFGYKSDRNVYEIYYNISTDLDFNGVVNRGLKMTYNKIVKEILQ